MDIYKIKSLLSQGRLREALLSLIDTTGYLPEKVPFTTELTFDNSKTMVATGSGEDLVFTVDLDRPRAKEGVIITISLPLGSTNSVDFSDPIFEIRRNDFSNLVNCVAYCSYEFDKVAVSLLPNVE